MIKSLIKKMFPEPREKFTVKLCDRCNEDIKAQGRCPIYEPDGPIMTRPPDFHVFTAADTRLYSVPFSIGKKVLDREMSLAELVNSEEVLKLDNVSCTDIYYKKELGIDFFSGENSGQYYFPNDTLEPNSLLIVLVNEYGAARAMLLKDVLYEDVSYNFDIEDDKSIMDQCHFRFSELLPWKKILI